jgi:hypothetical protein
MAAETAVGPADGSDRDETPDDGPAEAGVTMVEAIDRFWLLSGFF